MRHHHGCKGADESPRDGGVLEAEAGLAVEQRLDPRRVVREHNGAARHPRDLVPAHVGGVEAHGQQALGAHRRDGGAREGRGAGRAGGLAGAGVRVEHEGPSLVDVAVCAEQLRLGVTEGGASACHLLIGIKLAQPRPDQTVAVCGQLEF